MSSHGRIRDAYGERYLVFASRAPLARDEGTLIFANETDASRFLMGVATDDRSWRTLCRLVYELHPGAPYVLSQPEMIRVLATKLVTGELSVTPVGTSAPRREAGVAGTLGMAPTQVDRLRELAQRDRMLIVVRAADAEHPRRENQARAPAGPVRGGPTRGSGDYAVQAAFRLRDDGEYEEIADVSSCAERLNEQLSPDRPLFRKTPADGETGERFLLIHPDGGTSGVESWVQLRAFYARRGLRWRHETPGLTGGAGAAAAAGGPAGQPYAARPAASPPTPAPRPKPSPPPLAATDADALIRRRKQLAYEFYRQQGFPPYKISAHMRGIDWNQPVEVITLEKGTEVDQWQVPGAPQGTYYAPPGTDASSLGINSRGFDPATGTAVDKVATRYEVSEDVQVLHSKAASITDSWSVPGHPVDAKGGASQYFTANRNSFKR